MWTRFKWLRIESSGMIWNRLMNIRVSWKLGMSGHVIIKDCAPSHLIRDNDQDQTWHLSTSMLISVHADASFLIHSISVYMITYHLILSYITYSCVINNLQATLLYLEVHLIWGIFPSFLLSTFLSYFLSSFLSFILSFSLSFPVALHFLGNLYCLFKVRF